MTPDIDRFLGGAGYRKSLLVIGRDIGFSLPLQEYALDMAERMGYQIVALNISQLHRLRKMFSERSVDIVDEERRDAAREEGVEAFRQRVAEREIRFEAIIRSGGLDQVLSELHQERSDIDLIICEPEYVDAEDEGTGSIPVFSFSGEQG